MAKLQDLSASGTLCIRPPDIQRPHFFPLTGQNTALIIWNRALKPKILKVQKLKKWSMDKLIIGQSCSSPIPKKLPDTCHGSGQTTQDKKALKLHHK